MVVQIIKEKGIIYLIRKLLTNGDWFICKCEIFEGKLKFIKKTSPKNWHKTVASGEGTVENIPDPEKISGLEDLLQT